MSNTKIEIILRLSHNWCLEGVQRPNSGHSLVVNSASGMRQSLALYGKLLKI
jgi:hypothetical protein